MTSNAVRAARRALFLSDTVREQATASPYRTTLTAIADELLTASTALDRDHPPVLDGIVLTDVTPDELTEALARIVELADTLPAHAFPVALLAYISEPIGGRRPELDLDDDGGRQFFQQRMNLRIRISTVVHDLDWDSDGIMRTQMGNLFTLHVKWARLGESIAAMIARP